MTAKTGVDWTFDDRNALSMSALFSSEKILDRGDEPFFNANLTQRSRLWQFLEDELKTTVTATASYQHKYAQPGHLLNIGLNYTFHRENEQYFFTNIMPILRARTHSNYFPMKTCSTSMQTTSGRCDTGG